MKRFFLTIVALLVFLGTARIPAASGVENESLEVKGRIPVESNYLRIELLKKEIKQTGTYGSPKVTYLLQFRVTNLSGEEVTGQVITWVERDLRLGRSMKSKTENFKLKAGEAIIITKEGYFAAKAGFEEENSGWVFFETKSKEEGIKLKVKVP